mmetsp:Transcript_5992/g.23268  ORF Transcript_5992/g.23268 Transcript_5992/m.23268 type:complete len:202 (+) Transcript_5992:2753-3358(+)
MLRTDGLLGFRLKVDVLFVRVFLLLRQPLQHAGQGRFRRRRCCRRVVVSRADVVLSQVVPRRLERYPHVESARRSRRGGRRQLQRVDARRPVLSGRQIEGRKRRAGFADEGGGATLQHLPHAKHQKHAGVVHGAGGQVRRHRASVRQDLRSRSARRPRARTGVGRIGASNDRIGLTDESLPPRCCMGGVVGVGKPPHFYRD